MRCLRTYSPNERPLNIGCPQNSSYIIAPSEYMSARVSTARPPACSGDMYAGVPITDPAEQAALDRRCEQAEKMVASIGPKAKKPKSSKRK